MRWFYRGLSLVILLRILTAVFFRPAEGAPHASAAIVFGAAVRPGGEPSEILRLRVEAGARLYAAGQVERLLLSGGPGEPEAMARTATRLGVPAAALILDAGGVRTAATCRRARGFLGDGDVVLVTQAFHLPRALLLCNRAGLPAVGIAAADPGSAPTWLRNQLRELGSTTVAWLELLAP